MKTLNVNSILKSSKLQYKIEKVLGQGSFGITYLASTTIKVEGPLGSIETPIKVAIKEFFMRDINGRKEGTVTCSNQNGLYDRYKEKFIKEAQNLSKLKHRHIIKVLEVFEANNTYYYVMEFCEGGSLDDEIAKRGNLTEEETKRYARQIADALSYMHDNKMLHLDLKPGNAMLRGNGDVVLIDFGLSKQYDENGQPESSTTIGGGTPGYAPIEQSNYDGKGFPKTMDIYALGGTMFKMLTGKRPPEASIILNYGFSTDELRQQGVSEQMIGCIERSMSFRVADRPQSIADFLKLLDGEGVKTQDDDEATEIVGVERPKPTEPKKEEPKQELPNEQKHRKKKSKAWIFILLAIIVGGAGYYFVNEKMKGEKKKETEMLAQAEQERIKKEQEAAQIAQAQKEAEAKRKAEQERLEKERQELEAEKAELEAQKAEQARLEAERKRKEEEAKRKEEETKRKAEQARLEREAAEKAKYNGHEYVDLGLSVKWATCNVGANKPEDYGNYYAWGETSTKSTYYNNNSKTYGKRMNDIKGNSQYDAARANWGGTWRLPTKAELEELKNKCTWKWTTQNGVNGYKVTGPNGNSIFLPAAGYRSGSSLRYDGDYGGYWSSTPYDDNDDYGAYTLYFLNGSGLVSYYNRYYGLTVRPITE